MKPADAKLQRWIDLVATLLLHRYGVTFAELRALVPAYGGDKSGPTIARMFERDKDELRALGIPIRVRDEDTDDGQTQRYYIKTSEMYLPYLALVTRSGASRRKVPPEGYRQVPVLAFEPDELSALIHAARRAKAVGDSALTRDADSAIRKLSYDLGLGSVAGESELDAARLPDASATPSVGVLGEALLRRKCVTFSYRSINRDVVEQRTVEPYGLIFTSGHWYLSGRDAGAGALRKFRVSRMEQVSVNAKKPQSADYAIPNEYKLADHARTQEPWELGDGASEAAIVEIRSDTGATRSVRWVGDDVAGAPMQRSFRVRRMDSFVRWLMSFAGDVVPVSPPSLVAQFHAVASETLRAYVSAGDGDE